MPLSNGSMHKFGLYPSRYFMGLLLLLHAGAVWCVFALPLMWWAYVLIALVLLCSLIYYIRKYIQLNFSNSITTLELLDNSQWRLQQRNQTLLLAQLLGDSVVTRYVLILNFRVVDKKTRKTVIVFKDAMAANRFGELRLLCLNK